MASEQRRDSHYWCLHSTSEAAVISICSKNTTAHAQTHTESPHGPYLFYSTTPHQVKGSRGQGKSPAVREKGGSDPKQRWRKGGGRHCWHSHRQCISSPDLSPGRTAMVCTWGSSQVPYLAPELLPSEVRVPVLGMGEHILKENGASLDPALRACRPATQNPPPTPTGQRQPLSRGEA